MMSCFVLYREVVLFWGAVNELTIVTVTFGTSSNVICIDVG